MSFLYITKEQEELLEEIVELKLAIRAAIRKLDRPGMQHTVREVVIDLQKVIDD